MHDLETEQLYAEAERLRASGPDGEGRALELYKLVVQFLFDAGQYDKALAAIDKTLKIKLQADTLAKKGEILRLLGGQDRLREAKVALEEANRLEPDDGWAHVVYGETLRMLNLLDEAAAELKRGVELNSTVDDWHYRLGEVLLQLNRLPEARASLDNALRYNSKNAEALGRRGEVFHAMGLTPEALADFDGALQLTPNDPRTLACKGEALRTAGKLSDAAQALQQAIQLAPDGYPFAETSLGNVRLEQYRDGEALKWFDGSAGGSELRARARRNGPRTPAVGSEIEKSLAVSRRLLRSTAGPPVRRALSAC